MKSVVGKKKRLLSTNRNRNTNRNSRECCQRRVVLLGESHRRSVRALAKSPRDGRENRLRRLVESEESGLIVTPCCHDALSARLIENAGFQACFISGFTTSAARLAQPDCGLITYSEMIDQSRAIVENTNIPLIVDADAGIVSSSSILDKISLSLSLCLS